MTKLAYPEVIKRSKKELDSMNETPEGRLILTNERIEKTRVELNNLLALKESIIKSIPVTPSTQEVMESQLYNLIISTYIAGDSIHNITPEDVLTKYKFNISKDDLGDLLMSLSSAISNEIEFQLGIDVSSQKGKEEAKKVTKKLHKVLPTFDFTPYQDMSIDELRTYLNCYDDFNGGHFDGKNLIKDNIERACVGIYALAKGGSDITEYKY